MIDELQRVNREKDDDLRNIRQQYEDKITLVNDEIQNQMIKTTQAEDQVSLISFAELNEFLIGKRNVRSIKVI